MSKEQDQIKEQFGLFADRFGPKIVLPATVLAVNSDDTVKIRFSDESTIDDARLKSVVKAGNKFLLIPKVDSIVLVAKVENSDVYVVIAVQEITDVVFLIEDFKFSMTNQGFELTKGNTIEFSIKNAGFTISKDNQTVKDVLTNIIEACTQIVVIEGNNPDYGKLAQALASVNIIFS